MSGITLSEEDKALLAEFLHLQELQARENKLSSYRPYGWQKEFHAAGRENPERMLMAANRVGKCITYQTLIDTPTGRVSVGELYELGKPFDVCAWNGEVVNARASAPFKKPGLHECYRLFTRHGWVECADDHRVLIDGDWRFVQCLVESGAIRRLSSLESALLTRASDVRRWFQRLRGFLAGCLPGFRSGGERLPSGANIAQAAFPLSNDVPRHIAVSSGAGDRGCRYTSTDQPFFFRRASPGGEGRVLAPLGESSGRAAGTFCLPYRAIRREFLRLYAAVARGLRSIPVIFGPGRRTSSLKMAAPQSPVLASNEIIGYVSIGSQEAYDFTVWNYHTYIAGGLVHHNTFSGGAEVAMHAMGEYPDWWDGIRFTHPVLVWTGSPTNETSKDIVQNELLGGLGEELGTGAIPKERIIGKPSIRQAGVRDVVDTFKVRHKSGGTSRVMLKTYEQGWKKWQGTAPHVVWMDEEPDDYMIFTEAQTRILTSNGIIMVTFTPLSGVTKLVEHFQDDKKGVYMRGATWDDAPHLNEKAKRDLTDRYPDYQRDARTKGIPMLGEGAVFPVDEAEIKTDPFSIPEHWARIKGCDFGIDHPAAGAEIAWDRDQDVIYVIDCYRKKGEGSAYHASWFNKNPRMKWVPVAWPHDGMNREKSGGKELHVSYRNHGVNMLKDSARYEAQYNENEKGGAQPVEPIVMELLDRMLTGRFKVFSNLNEWFEEYRSYHRKDGRIVDRRDDILKATMYAVMMRRKAVTPIEARPRRRETMRSIAS